MQSRAWSDWEKIKQKLSDKAAQEYTALMKEQLLAAIM